MHQGDQSTFARMSRTERCGGDDLDELAAPQRVYGCGRVVHVDEQPAGENGEGEVDWWRAGSARSDARGPQSKNGNVPADFGNNEVGGALFGPWEPVPAHILNTLSLPMSRGWANNNTLPPPNTMLPYQMRPTIMLRIVDRLPKSDPEQRGWQKGFRGL